jgi:hypothetical protein
MRLAVFGYGSLVNPQSLARTLGRDPGAPSPARLASWRRRWSVMRDQQTSEKAFARADSGEVPRWVIALNVEPDEADRDLAPNGALIEVSAGELDRLDVREMRYDRVEVTGQILGGDRFDGVFTYTAKPEHFAPQPPGGAVAMAPYLRAIEAAFRDLGEGEWELFLTTTGLPPVETMEPVLIRDEIPPGNPRDW